MKLVEEELVLGRDHLMQSLRMLGIIPPLPHASPLIDVSIGTEKTLPSSSVQN
jgi:hypothetical protein